MRQLFLLVNLALSLIAFGQQTYPVNGVADERHTLFAFTNAVIHASPETRLESATMLVKDGKIIAIGNAVEVPKEAVIRNCKGQHIYPSFIDIYAAFGQAQSKSNKENRASSPTENAKEASNWNPAIHPEYGYLQKFPVDRKLMDDYLSSGIGLVSVHARDGIMRGSGQLIFTGISEPNKAVINGESANYYSFSKGTSKNPYPTSFMGAIALLRQTFYDAIWYGSVKQNPKEYNPSLEALLGVKRELNIFEINEPLSIRNVSSLQKEFGIQFAIKGTGMEYRVLKTLPKDARLIIPISFPKPMDVSDPYMARMVSLDQLKYWEEAPFNLYFLNSNELQFAITRDTIKSSDEFHKNLRKAINSGLPVSIAQAALTTIPAEWLGISNQFGTLSIGKDASFFIANQSLEDEKFKVLEHWNHGNEVYKKALITSELTGTYNLVISKTEIELTIAKAEENKVEASAKNKLDNKDLKVDVKVENELVSLVILSKDSSAKVLYRLSGKMSLNGGIWDGRGQDAEGAWTDWAAVKAKPKPSKTEQSKPSALAVPDIRHPMIPKNLDSLKKSNSFAITNATIWTSGPQGILHNADILVENGKIKMIGENMLLSTDVKRINANGKFVTAGIIDEHSHIAIRGGVNEAAQSVSAEVRIGDAVDPWNYHIYRQLAGGVTAAQLLHGSANPIGGQSAIVKLKWGVTAEEMLIPDAPGFIKFALGENVKRSLSQHNDRFPNTRMGVEQTIADAFVRAKEYQSKQQPISLSNTKGKNSALNPTAPIRRNLELDAISEILNDTRKITCHSYVQSEILMLMNLGDSLDFHVNTFTHILEGYKVADVMKQHGANASTFSDWWAYKFEVNDAIPYNAALLTKMGVNTAINSDDAEMGRRLNQEAAKAIKYGSLNEIEAWNLVTINPAKMLHIDHRTGSLEVGKDADIVIWSDNPLSVYAHPEKTYVEGVLYFDLGKQESLQKQVNGERARIIGLMLKSNESGLKPAKGKKERNYHCDTLIENYLEE